MIILYKQYLIDSDGTQFILQKQVEAEKKDTKEKYIRKDNVGYYPSLETALKGCLHKILLEEVQEKTMTLKEVIEVIEKFHSSFREYLNGQ
ncbi:hypothetical protein B5F14_01795 [Faecalitalea cylindroides]|uniref:DUF5405 domain-containing protein n=1 Tax=Faecalitalea cylindroides TaxID=39483 RepID=A0A1Y4LYP4_9FIRM|nr:hypothetical protein [Faecalitalea cylindroides]OUP61715.1 hypothetical protein B5F14_01795 [Faecalitalea cylindroides]